MVSIKDLAFSYGTYEILRNVSFDVNEGECVALLGNNGAGKSTLINCVNRIKTPKRGCVVIDGKSIPNLSRTEIAQNIAYVAQKNEISRMTVFDCILLGRKPYIKWTVSDNDLDICENVIKRLDLESMKLRYVDELSGGEQQKVMLARALVQEPKLLLLDEVTSNLDPKNQYESLGLVQEIVKEKNISAIIVIHDLNLALRYCDKFVLLKDGEVYTYGDFSVITKENLKIVYGIDSEVVEINSRKIVVID